jgi:hypothetical protein
MEVDLNDTRKQIIGNVSVDNPPKTTEYKFFSKACGTFSRLDHVRA